MHFAWSEWCNVTAASVVILHQHFGRRTDYIQFVPKHKQLDATVVKL